MNNYSIIYKIESFSEINKTKFRYVFIVNMLYPRVCVRACVCVCGVKTTSPAGRIRVWLTSGFTNPTPGGQNHLTCWWNPCLANLGVYKLHTRGSKPPHLLVESESG